MPSSVEKIVFLDQGTLPHPLRKPDFPHEWVTLDHTPAKDVVERLQGATITITNKVRLGAEDLAKVPTLKFIAVAATGYDCVDLAACRARGIVVSNVPGYTGDSVPEHVFMLMLALRRHLIGYHRLVEKGAWQKASHFVMQDYPIENLSGSVLGLIGYGRLAQAVEKRALAFGMKVLLSERKGIAQVRPGRMPFEDVLKQADVVSLHCPLTSETRGMINVCELGMMKKTALLINTARGGLVDEQALADALKSGYLAGAGIDVLAEEPPRSGSPLLDLHLPQLIVTPHAAWSSRQALAVLAEEIILNMESFVAGQPRHRVA
jgi:glycerate dehydrogenase